MKKKKELSKEQFVLLCKEFRKQKVGMPDYCPYRKDLMRIQDQLDRIFIEALEWTIEDA